MSVKDDGGTPFVLQKIPSPTGEGALPDIKQSRSNNMDILKDLEKRAGQKNEDGSHQRQLDSFNEEEQKLMKRLENGEKVDKVNPLQSPMSQQKLDSSRQGKVLSSISQDYDSDANQGSLKEAIKAQQMKPTDPNEDSDFGSPMRLRAGTRANFGIQPMPTDQDEEKKKIEDAKVKKENMKKPRCYLIPRPFFNLMKCVLDNKVYIFFMTVITIYALFGDDIRLCATDKPADAVFYGITSACLFFFSLEIVIASIVTEDYFLGFYFWLDLLATLSLISDIGWIWDRIVGNQEASAEDAQQASQLARAGRGARVGTKASRIIRIVRLIRLIRIVKLYKHASNAMSKKEKKNNEIDPNVLNSVNDRADMPKESKVGKKLSDLTTRRVIILVLAMMFSVPAFTLTTYKPENTSYELGLKLVNKFTNNMTSPAFTTMFNSYINQHKDIRTPLITLNVKNTTWQSPKTSPKILRSTEGELVSIENGDLVAIFDLRANSRLNAGLGICRTIFVCVVLSAGAMLFSRDATNLVILPIEHMIHKVNRIAENPLMAAQEEEAQALALQAEQDGYLGGGKKKKKKKKDGPYETVILEQTIVKIGALLALGFGEAGSNIIADNMKHSGDVDPMIPGKKIIGIFGFCDIRQFTDTTEILQEAVMLFVNEIAEIVHGVVDSFTGAANKNIGDAFLLVWKINDEYTEVDDEDQLQMKTCNESSQIADMSVLSFVKIVAQVKRSRKCDKYKHNPHLNKRMKNYSVKMGFGLHVGWAIEGAIGSDFKIDVSYLSPNVNMSESLEGATKQFGTPLLISGHLYDHFTKETKVQMRAIDVVILKGSEMKLRLYTCDMDTSDIPVDPPTTENPSKQELKTRRVLNRMARDKFYENAMNNQIQVSDKFELDEDIVAIRKSFTKDFFDTYQKGFDNYIEGDWMKAKEIFDTIEEVKGSIDFPTKCLLDIMEKENYQAPQDWEGYRMLNE